MTETLTPTVDNVLDVYRDASFYALSTGLTWYDDAHNTARAIDPKRFHRAAGVIAALSPMSGWNNNKNKAIQLYRQNGDGTGIGLKSSVSKAQAIYSGTDALDVLNGPKTRAFFLTIIDPYGDHIPVIDRHAFDIAVGRVTDDKIRGILGRKGVYNAFSDVYREAARIVNIGTAQMQAVTWVAWRERKGLDWAG